LAAAFAEALTATGPDLRLRGDQLTDEVRFDLAPRGEGLQLLEAIVERERVGFEQCELLLDRHGEVASVLELFARRRQCWSTDSFCSLPLLQRIKGSGRYFKL